MMMAGMAADKKDPSERRGITRRFLPAVIILAGLALGYALGLHQYLSLSYLAESREALKAHVAANPILAPAAFAAFYTLAVAFSFPAASVLTLFAGFLFGWLLGGALVVVAATIGSSILFLIARSTFGDFLTRKLGGRAAQMAQGFEKNAFGYLLVLRLAPIFPFWVVNIAPALFNVRLKTYVLATLLGIVPATFAYAYLGRGLDSTLTAAARAGSDVTLGDLVTPELTIAFAALAAVAAIPLVIKVLRRQRNA